MVIFIADFCDRMPGASGIRVQSHLGSDMALYPALY